MNDTARRVLDPVERVSEVLFGLIMVLTFTGSMSVADAGRAEVREMLAGALGCNLAWGIVDAVMYVLGSVLTRARAFTALKAVREAADPAQARAIIAVALVPPRLTPATLEAIRQDLVARPAVPPRSRLTTDDLRGAAAVFLLVFLSTFPVALPFLLFPDVARASPTRLPWVCCASAGIRWAGTAGCVPGGRLELWRRWGLCSSDSRWRSADRRRVDTAEINRAQSDSRNKSVDWGGGRRGQGLRARSDAGCGCRRALDRCVLRDRRCLIRDAAGG